MLHRLGFFRCDHLIRSSEGHTEALIKNKLQRFALFGHNIKDLARQSALPRFFYIDLNFVAKPLQQMFRKVIVVKLWKGICEARPAFMRKPGFPLGFLIHVPD